MKSSTILFLLFLTTDDSNMEMHERTGGQVGELSGSEWFKVAEWATAERQTRPDGSEGSGCEIISGVPLEYYTNLHSITL